MNNRTKKHPVTLLRLCSDVIIRPDGSVAVLEIGKLDTAGFSGHDDNNQDGLTKQQEVMRDLHDLARAHEIPIYLVGQPDLLKDEHREEAVKQAGLFWSEQAVRIIDMDDARELTQLADTMRAKSLDGFNPEDMSTYHCLVVALPYVSLSSVGSFFNRMFASDKLKSLRELPGVYVVNDKYSEVHQSVFDSKVVSGVLLPEKYTPKTLTLPRIYTPQLAAEIIAAFPNTRRAVIKPSHAARALGVIVLDLDNQASLDRKLKSLLDPGEIEQRQRRGVMQFDINLEKRPEDYWLIYDMRFEPVFVVQEFVESAAVAVGDHRYQSVTRFTFTCVHSNGETRMLFHGRPYHKLASKPCENGYDKGAFISKVHDDDGPCAVLVRDDALLPHVEAQLRDCFQQFVGNMLSYVSSPRPLEHLYTLNNIGKAVYAAVVTCQRTLEESDYGFLWRTFHANPAYAQTFFADVKGSSALDDEETTSYKLAANLIKAFPIRALTAIDINSSQRKQFCQLVWQALLPNLHSIWDNATPIMKLNIFVCMVNALEYTSYKKYHVNFDFVHDADRDRFKGMLDALLGLSDINVVLQAVLWCCERLISARAWVYNEDDLAEYYKTPYISMIIQAISGYQDKPQADKTIKDYIRIANLYALEDRRSVAWPFQLGGHDARQKLGLIVTAGQGIIAGLTKGVGVSTQIGSVSHPISYTFVLLRDFFDKYPHLVRRNANALRLLLLTAWISGDNGSDWLMLRNWGFRAAPLAYLWCSFTEPQDVVNAAWNMSLNRMVESAYIPNDASHAINYISRKLINNQLIVNNPRRSITNFSKIIAWLDEHKDDDPANLINVIFMRLRQADQDAQHGQSARLFSDKRMATTGRPAATAHHIGRQP